MSFSRNIQDNQQRVELQPALSQDTQLAGKKRKATSGGNHATDPEKKIKHANVEAARRERVKENFEWALRQLNVRPEILDRYTGKNAFAGQCFTAEMRAELEKMLAGEASELVQDPHVLEEKLSQTLMVKGHSAIYGYKKVTVYVAIETFLKSRKAVANADVRRRNRQKQGLEVRQGKMNSKNSKTADSHNLASAQGAALLSSASANVVTSEVQVTVETGQSATRNLRFLPGLSAPANDMGFFALTSLCLETDASNMQQSPRDSGSAAGSLSFFPCATPSGDPDSEEMFPELMRFLQN